MSNYRVCPTGCSVMFYDGQAYVCSFCGCKLFIKEVRYADHNQNVVSTPLQCVARPMSPLQSNAKVVGQTCIQEV